MLRRAATLRDVQQLGLGVTLAKVQYTIFLCAALIIPCPSAICNIRRSFLPVAIILHLREDSRIAGRLVAIRHSIHHVHYYVRFHVHSWCNTRTLKAESRLSQRSINVGHLNIDHRRVDHLFLLRLPPHDMRYTTFLIVHGYIPTAILPRQCKYS